MNWLPKKRLNSVLGLNFSGERLSICYLTRVKGALVVVKSVTVTLAAELSSAESDLVGSEIRRHLDAAGIRERMCIVGLPSQWIMSQSSKVPELSAADLDSFLLLEAEKTFPSELDQLQISRSVCRAGDVRCVTQLAVRRERIDHLTSVLKSAGLNPVSYSLGLAALPHGDASPDDGRIIVEAELSGAAILIAAGGGILAVRSGDAENELHRSVLNRELRVTFQQVPDGLRAPLRVLEFCGDESLVKPLAENLAGWAATTGLKLVRRQEEKTPLGEQMAEGLASAWLENKTTGLEFFPPVPSRWSGLVARYNSKRLTTVGGAVGVVALLTIVVFGWQEFRLWSLRSDWGAIQGQVTNLESVQSNIREYRPWYDTSFYNLSILRRVTECFPDNGSVTAKSFEIRGPSAVSITGTATDNLALLRTMDQLRKAREIQGLKVEQIHGKTPLQFTLSFRWNSHPGS